jgi:hypothetical protein
VAVLLVVLPDHLVALGQHRPHHKMRQRLRRRSVAPAARPVAGAAAARLSNTVSGMPEGRTKAVVVPTEIACGVVPRLEHGIEWEATMGRQAAVVLYVIALVAVVVGVDVLFFRHRFWERLIVNVGIVLVFAAFGLRFLKRP